MRWPPCSRSWASPCSPPCSSPGSSSALVVAAALRLVGEVALQLCTELVRGRQRAGGAERPTGPARDEGVVLRLEGRHQLAELLRLRDQAGDRLLRLAPRLHQRVEGERQSARAGDGGQQRLPGGRVRRLR